MEKGDVEALVAEAVDGQVSDMKKTVRRLQERLAKEKDRTQTLFDAVYEAVHDGLSAIEIPDYKPPKKDRRTKGEETAICVLSDWQLGKKTPTYSSETCAERVKRYCEKVTRIVEIQRDDHPVKRVALFLLGDMIEGELIFPGQSWEIDSSLYKQMTVDGPEILMGVVDWAASNFEQVDIYAVPGNHGYLGGRSRRDMHKESNGDRMLYQITSMLTEKGDYENVNWEVAEDWWAVADLGENSKFFLLHGEDVRGYAGIPWYGWQRKLMGLTSLERIWPDMTFDHMVAGHFHTPVSIYINGRRLWINASTESHNPYAARQLSAAGEPAQWLLFSKPGKGVTAEYLVDLK